MVLAISVSITGVMICIFSFPRYERPERTDAFDIPMHFLIVTLLAIALEQIGVWAEKYFSDEFKKKRRKAN